MNNQRILAHFHESAEIKIQSATVLAPHLAQAIELMFSALSNGHKILVCGNGGSAADAQHFAAELVGRFRVPNRPGLPVITLGANQSVTSAWANDDDWSEALAREVQALGRRGDLLLGISTSGTSRNVVRA